MYNGIGVMNAKLLSKGKRIKTDWKWLPVGKQSIKNPK